METKDRVYNTRARWEINPGKQEKGNMISCPHNWSAVHSTDQQALTLALISCPLGSIHFLEGGWARGNQGRIIKFLPTQKGRVSINMTQERGGSLQILPLPGQGSHFLTKTRKGGLGDFTFMLIGIPPAHPPRGGYFRNFWVGMCR